MSYAPNAKPTQSSAQAGTMIEVYDGQKPVETLQVGDLVRTKDNGFQEIRWIGARTVRAADFATDPSLRPIRIKAGALGASTPSRDLRVSQQHCVVLDDWRCELLFGEDEVLAPARALLNDDTITIDHSCEEVTFYHFLFDRHEIVYSNGVETESFHPAFASEADLDSEKHHELVALFPELDGAALPFGAAARTVLTDIEVEVLHTC